jgi:hypothetical protein
MSWFAQVAVSTEASPSHWMTEFQILKEYRHLKRMWAAVLGSRLQSWQFPQFGYPRFLSRSAIHTRFCKISHAKSWLVRETGSSRPRFQNAFPEHTSIFLSTEFHPSIFLQFWTCFKTRITQFWKTI